MLVENYRWFCQKVLPLVYDESLSYYEVLCKLTDYILKLSQSELDLEAKLDEFKARQDTLEQQFAEIVNQWAIYKQHMEVNFGKLAAEVKAELTEMAGLLEAVKNGEYVDLYLDSIKAYIDQNLQSFVAGLVSYVTFGISNDGHFVAYIPPTWQFLKFNTIEDPASPLYGHLTLQY